LEFEGKLRNKIIRLEKKIFALENSVSLRVGMHIVESVRNPWRLLILPISLIYVAIVSSIEYNRQQKIEKGKRITTHESKVEPIKSPTLSNIDQIPKQKPPTKEILLSSENQRVYDKLVPHLCPSENQRVYDKLVPHFCPSERHNFQYKILEIIHSFFNERDIDYWAIGGTLLGSVKYSGTIPWDHDIDIFCEKLSRKNEQELMKTLSSMDGTSTRPWLWSGRIPGMQVIDVRKKKGIAIDIFYGHFYEDTIYTVGMNIEKFPEKGRQGIDRIIKPGIRTVNFGNVMICVPNIESTMEYLNWKFGEDWVNEYVIFDFKEKTSISFPANTQIDKKLRSSVINRSLQ